VAAALQCPDCGHQEMLDQLGGVTTFRCGGCGRALKVPAQFRDAAPPPRSAAPAPNDATRAMPKVRPRPAATPPITPVAPVTPVPGGLANAGVPTARTPTADGGIDLPPARDGASSVPPAAVSPAAAGATPPAPESLTPPLILRFALWVIALPLGSLIVFALASAFHVLTKSQLEDTFLRADWGRFVPIARILPFCALATALIVQLGVFLLEQLRARNLRARQSGTGRGPGGARPRPSRPLSPRGPAQRATNGDSRRDRVTS
jgi:hypothetical protein